MISVLMTAYNSARFIGAAIQSVRLQTLSDWELIIVDDCSTDKTGEIIQRYSTKDSRIMAFTNPTNEGHTRSMNTAMKIAKGDFLACQDSDDISAPKRLEEQLECFNGLPGVGVCTTWATTINENGDRIKNWYTDSAQREKKSTIGDKLKDDCWLCMASRMWRREVVEKIGIYDNQCYHCQDYNYLCRMLKHFDFAIIQHELYKVRKHSNNVRSKAKAKSRNWKEFSQERARKCPVIL